MGGIARCTIVGCIGKYGVEVRYATSGTPCASFTLVVSEQGSDGKVHELYVPCEVWRQKPKGPASWKQANCAYSKASWPSARRVSSGRQWLAGYEVVPILAPLPTLTGSTN